MKKVIENGKPILIRITSEQSGFYRQYFKAIRIDNSGYRTLNQGMFFNLNEAETVDNVTENPY